MEELLEFKDLGNGTFYIKFKTEGNFFYKMKGIVKSLSASLSDYLEGEATIGLADLPDFASWYVELKNRKHDDLLKEALKKVLDFEQALQSYLDERDCFEKISKFKVLVFVYGFEFVQKAFSDLKASFDKSPSQDNLDKLRSEIWIFDMVDKDLNLNLWKHDLLVYRFLIFTNFYFFRVENGADEYDVDLLCDIFKVMYSRQNNNSLKLNLLFFVQSSNERFLNFVKSLIKKDKFFENYLAKRIRNDDTSFIDNIVPFLTERLKNIYAKEVLFRGA